MKFALASSYTSIVALDPDPDIDPGTIILQQLEAKLEGCSIQKTNLLLKLANHISSTHQLTLRQLKRMRVRRRK